MTRISLYVLFVATLAGAGASRQIAPTAPSYPIGAAPESFRDAVLRGDVIVAAMQSALHAELTKEMQRGGPEGAVKVCHLDATAVSQQVARKQGVAAGRTSHRLRNPTNAPRPWAAPIVASHAGKPIAGVDGFVVDLGDRVGLLRPIGFRGACAACHGPRERLAPQVLKELQDRYPGDQAVGFKDGDIRGWFWVEIPKTP
jgi:mono/diheme cytochrome c family protein